MRTFEASILRGLFQAMLMAVKINKTVRELLIYFFIGGGALLIICIGFGARPDLIKVIKLIIYYGLTFIAFATISNKLADYIAVRFPWVENPTRTFVIALIGTFVTTTLVWLLVVYMWIVIIGGKFPSLDNWYNNLNISSWTFSLLMTIMGSAILHGKNFLKGWKQTILEAEKLKKEQVIAQYETLKSQVNPHFLFNSLNVLTTLVHKDADVAEQFINQLSKVYRYILESRSQEIIGLDEEMRNLEAYVFLMKIRFGGNLQFDNQLANNVLGKKVAPLTLQMLVENALKHNEVSKLNPLSISVFLDGNFIVVKNNLQLKTNQNDSTGIGLSNIKARYSFLSQHSVSISETDSFLQ